MTHPKPPTPRADLALVVQRAELARRRALRFELLPDAAARADLCHALGLAQLRKLRFAGVLEPLGKLDWELRASLGATVVQPCVVTLDPVTTRIEETVERRFLSDFSLPEAAEAEAPDDENAEALGDVIDLGAVAIEALTLALPPFPRVPQATLGADGALAADPPGAAPLNDEPRRPFAGLAALRVPPKGTDDPTG